MGYVAQLVKGNRTLKLDGTAGLKIGLDFVPPSTQFENIIGSGTSMNQYGGGNKFSDRAVNTSWTFSVRSMGSSNAICEQQLDSLDNFLQQAGDPNEPLYFEFRPDGNVGFEPTWGQRGANLRVEIVAVDSRGLWDIYGLGQLRERVIMADIGLQIKPFALGKQQRLCTASGGVLEDTIGTIDGRSRGLAIPPAITTNYFTNPIFGNPADWDHDWTVTGALIATQNIDKNFVLFGNNSARLSAHGAANAYTQSLTLPAVSHLISFYAKRPDGGAVTAADCAIYYDGNAEASSYQAIGDNGWYRVFCYHVGSAAAAGCGVILSDDYTIYVDGFSATTENHFSPLCYGDLLGCAWAGAANDSTSSRTAGLVSLPAADYLMAGEGTIRVVWRPHFSSVIAAVGQTFQLFYTTGGIRAGWFETYGGFYFNDGTNEINGVAAFTTETSYILHFVYGPGSLKIYLNGAQHATGATFEPVAPGANIFIGTDSGGANPAGGTFEGFTTFPRAMSATEVTADYNNLAQLTANKQRVDWIPWLWTKDGDNVCDYYCDATHDSQAIVNGIPGDVDAKTIFQILSTVTGSGTEVLLSQGVYDTYVKQSAAFQDLSGTADGAALGGEYKTNAITAGTPVGIGTISTASNMEYYLGQNNWILFATRDHGTSAQYIKADIYYSYGGLNYWTAKYKTLAADNAGIKPFFIGPTRFADSPKKAYPWITDSTLGVSLIIDRLSGAAVDNHVDWYEVLTGRLAYIKQVGIRTADSFAILEGQTAYEINASGVLTSHLIVFGDSIELTPNKYNMLTVWSGLFAENQALTNTSTFTRVYVTPRWITA